MVPNWFIDLVSKQAPPKYYHRITVVYISTNLFISIFISCYCLSVSFYPSFHVYPPFTVSIGMFTHTHTHTYIYLYICTHTHTHTHIHTSTCMSVWLASWLLFIQFKTGLERKTNFKSFSELTRSLRSLTFLFWVLKYKL